MSDENDKQQSPYGSEELNNPFESEGPVQGEPVAAPGEIGRQSRNLAMLCHLLGIFTFFVGSLIIWLIKMDEDKFIDEHGREALNWQITLAIAGVVVSITVILIPIAIPVLMLANFIFCIMGAIEASKGRPYRYPVALRLVK